jgi:cytochrome c biogenesis protein CcmG, thiol:disulfide interchange protein DsbE
MKKNILLFPFLVFILVLSIFFYLLLIERNPSKVPSNLINKSFPVFESKSLITNKKIISSDIFKDKIILVNFFATWCKPCRDEHNFIMQLANKNNLKIFGINYKDNSKKTQVWLKDLGNPYSDVLIDKNGKIAIDWGVYGIPETFIINSKGIIKYRHTGPITKKIYKKIYALIKEIN